MLAADLIDEGERMSTRKLEERRAITVEHYPNFIKVISDNSLVILTYNEYTAKPFPDKPGEGSIQITLSNRKNDLLLNLLHSVYTKERCVQLEALKYGREVPVVAIDIKPIESDGNLYALCVAGVNAILSKLGHRMFFTPRIFTYSSVDGQIIVDPDHAELEVSEWRIYIVMRSKRELLLVERYGFPCDPETIHTVICYAYEEAARDY